MDSNISSFPPLPSHPTPLSQPSCADPSLLVDATPSELLISSMATPSLARIPLVVSVPTTLSWSSLFLQNRVSALKKTLKHFTLQEVNGVTQVPMDLIIEARHADLEEGSIFIGGCCFIISPSTRVELAPGDERIITFEYHWIPKRCEKCQKFGHETEKCLGDANLRRLNTTNRSGRMSKLNTIQSTGLDANNPTGTTVQHEPNGMSSGPQENGTEVEELNTGIYENGTDLSIRLQLALYVPAEITTPIV
ncbi:hypothetical protein IFM89_032207 [Coptis chinensis]|uniref:Zinc knuckle CX2CX4HX4C domain-containing protein n=1 Tax=Coptis chinensis TaxID=261450 RepID=A0A835M1B2_9MAGN|nr:hypothetical protein IFM89_032207 [Coptis chinensis]